MLVHTLGEHRLFGKVDVKRPRGKTILKMKGHFERKMSDAAVHATSCVGGKSEMVAVI